MYRLLFLFYIEARPDLGYAPMNADAYRMGYSLERLRDLEMVPLHSEEALGRLLPPRLHPVALPADPGRSSRGRPESSATGRTPSTSASWTAPCSGRAPPPLLDRVRLRNRVLQPVIRLMSHSGHARPPPVHSTITSTSSVSCRTMTSAEPSGARTPGSSGPHLLRAARHQPARRGAMRRCCPTAGSLRRRTSTRSRRRRTTRTT